MEAGAATSERHEGVDVCVLGGTIAASRVGVMCVVKLEGKRLEVGPRLRHPAKVREGVGHKGTIDI